MLVQIEYCHQVVALAREKSPMVVWIEGHSVIFLAAPNWIFAYDLVGCGIDNRKEILILQVHID
jgi:hypothetical protein